MKTTRRAFLTTAAAAAGVMEGQVQANPGRFWRLWWYEPGVENGNPGFNKRFRVNSPETSLHPEFGSRSEARSSGMLQILMLEDPRRLDAVELYCELWGGHPGTANRRVGINGRSLYPLPENGTAAGHCTHLYPTIPLRLTDVVNGYNALQFACDLGTTFWGHFIVDHACLRAGLRRDHPDLKKLELDGFQARVQVEPGPNETLRLTLESNAPKRIRRVHFRGFYEGYDENGDGLTRDWHGFTKGREPVAWLGSAAAAPFRATWDTAMAPEGMASVRATVLFHDAPGLVYETAASDPFVLPAKQGARVYPIGAASLPVPFWSRAKKRITARIDLPLEPSAVERAELHVVVWDGGRGTVKEPFRLNGRALEVCGKGAHDVIYSVLPVPRELIERRNLIELESDTDHHGIEVLLPGPCLMVRVNGSRG